MTAEEVEASDEAKAVEGVGAADEALYSDCVVGEQEDQAFILDLQRLMREERIANQKRREHKGDKVDKKSAGKGGENEGG